ncbi:MAG TPA: hypothetical protein VGX23_05485 [Actinocrinis sp.]|nr:hypothetical protein [Actinocrinis sp.]
MASSAVVSELIDGFAALKNQQGVYKTTDSSVGELRMWRFVGPLGFALVVVTPDSASAAASIEIVGAGGIGLKPAGELFRLMALPEERFRFASPFASRRGDGLVLTGMQLQLPLSLVGPESPEMLEYVTAMIGNLGQVARQTAVSLLGTYGGRLIEGESEEDVEELFSAATGH